MTGDEFVDHGSSSPLIAGQEGTVPLPVSCIHETEPAKEEQARTDSVQTKEKKNIIGPLAPFGMKAINVMWQAFFKTAPHRVEVSFGMNATKNDGKLNKYRLKL